MRLRFLLPFIICFSFIIVFFSSLVLAFHPKDLNSWEFLHLSGVFYAQFVVKFFLTLSISAVLLLALRWNDFKSYLFSLNMDPNLFKKRLLASLVITSCLFGIFYLTSSNTAQNEPEETSYKQISEEDQQYLKSVQEQIQNIDENKSETNLSEPSQEQTSQESIKPEPPASEVLVPDIVSIEDKNIEEASKIKQFKLKYALSLLRIKGLSNVSASMNMQKAAKELELSTEELIKMFKTHEKIMTNQKSIGD